MKRLAGALAFLGVSMTASAAMGQEIQIRGPLANAVSCRRCVQYRAGRVSIAPTYGITLVDEFDRTMWVGAQLNYHFNDLIAIGAWGGYAVAHIPTSLTGAIRRNLAQGGAFPPEGQAGGSESDLNALAASDRTDPYSNSTPNVPRGERFNQQIGQLNWFISVPQLTLIPLRGKLALFQNIFLDTDFYIFAGLAIVGVTERANYDVGASDAGVNQPVYSGDSGLFTNQVMRASRVAFTGTFGVGLNFYITHFLSLSVEYRAFPFSWNTSGFDNNTTAQTCGANGMGSCSGFPDYQVDRDTSRNTSMGGVGGRFIVNSDDWTFHWNQMVNFSFNIFLPTSPRRGD